MKAEKVDNLSSRFGNDFGYAGDVSVREAWDMLSAQKASVLVDVRTAPEWAFSGFPNLDMVGKKPVLLSWREYPEFQINSLFLDCLAEQFPDKRTPLIFICKTGGRSREAAIAMTARGYCSAYNVDHGFEGEANAAGQRGRITGWKAEGLPWQQA